MKRFLTSLPALGCAILAGLVASSGPVQGQGDAVVLGNWLDEGRTEEEKARRTAAYASAGSLRLAHARIDDALHHATDTRLLDHYRARGYAPATSTGFNPFSLDEHTEFERLRIEARICGDWLISYFRPDHAGRVTWTPAEDVWTFGALDRVTDSGHVQLLNRESPVDPEIVACNLPSGAPAIVTRWRALATERQKDKPQLDSRRRPCPDGEVGSGIRETRKITIVRDGHGNEVAAETIDTGWVEGYRNCRTPNTGWTGGRPVECTSPTGLRSMRVMQYPWTEQRVPADDYKVQRVVDWTAGIVMHDHCRGGVGEVVDEDVDITYEYRDRTCDEEYTGGPRAWVDDHNGPSDARHRRQKRESTITFPPSWNRPDQIVISFEPWTRFEDDCRLQVAQSDTREEGGCSGVTYSRDWVEITYPSPLPPVANYIKPGSDTGWVQSGTYDRCPPPDSGDDDNDDGGGNQYCVSGCGTDHPGLHDYDNVNPGTGTEDNGGNNGND